MRENRLTFQTLALALCLLLAGGEAFQAMAQSTTPPKSLQIVILDGEGALNNIKQRTAHEPIVQVQDENHKPVAGAAVLFLLPNSGPGGTFADGAQTLSTITDAEGKAVAHGLIPNSASGNFQIQVRVTYNGLRAESNISQTNGSESAESRVHTGHHSVGKWVLVGSAVAATGIVIGILATRNSNTGSQGSLTGVAGVVPAR